MTWKTDAKKIVATLFGLAVAGLSGFLLWRTMQQAAPDRHLVYLFAGGIAFGMAFVLPSVFFDTAKKFLALLPSVRIGGETKP